MLKLVAQANHLLCTSDYTAVDTVVSTYHRRICFVTSEYYDRYLGKIDEERMAQYVYASKDDSVGTVVKGSRISHI
jgi:hypothetical protein